MCRLDSKDLTANAANDRSSLRQLPRLPLYCTEVGCRTEYPGIKICIAHGGAACRYMRRWAEMGSNRGETGYGGL